MERGALIAGRYELTELLGRGGMGEVWAGRDRELHRSVAVKLLHRDDNAPPELVQRFEREAVAAAQINHPNIVALYDRGTHGHLQFLVMEHVQGASLAQYLHRQGPLNLERALKIAQEICAALVAAHEAHVVHYDIKPSNVMLTADGSIKVVDFGIAGFTHTHTFTVAPTAALSPAGTAQYGAPEQFLDQRGDERSDLYALGSVLFALLTGEPPFGDGTPLSVIRRKLDEEPRQVAELRPDVPASVAQLLTDLLRRDPEDRPRTATSVRQRLTRLRTISAGQDTGEVETEPVPPPPATRTLGTGRPETEDSAQSTDTEMPKFPAAGQGAASAPTPPAAEPAPLRHQLVPDPGIGPGPEPGPPARRSAVRTATVVTSLACLLTVPCISMATDHAVKVGEMPNDSRTVQMTLISVQAAMLAVGVLLLLVRNTAGRWLIAAGGTCLALQTAYIIGFVFNQSVVYLAAATAALSAIFALLPSAGTRRQRPR